MDAVGGSGLAPAPPGRDTSWRQIGECTEQKVRDKRRWLGLGSYLEADAAGLG